ncbi:MAG: hypothetical protein KGI28_06965 [Thaumarchaeota archaeon]|nr:hypothetical protein [Nitrososphaerota archaeon]
MAKGQVLIISSHVIFIVLGKYDYVIQCYNGDCKFTILRGTECNRCGTDNTLEALEASFKILQKNDLEAFNKFMIIHFPVNEIREKHETRLISLEKEHLVSRLQKIKKV